MSDTNEPAFPIHGALNAYQFTGMTMRDYFAAKAMQAQISAFSTAEEYSPDGIAKVAYLVADAMLKARSK